MEIIEIRGEIDGVGGWFAGIGPLFEISDVKCVRFETKMSNIVIHGNSSFDLNTKSKVYVMNILNILCLLEIG